jgi:hypothetical protein
MIKDLDPRTGKARGIIIVETSVEPLPRMQERVDADLGSSATQASLDERAYANGLCYGPVQPVIKSVSHNGLITENERTD